MANQTPKTTILDLPVDILVLIFPYLDAASFLSLTSTCKALHKPDFTHDSTYWSALVRRDFRVPNQPVVQNDGQRWQRLYKRLRTQSKVFTWGNNEKGCLGHSYENPTFPAGPGRIPRRVNIRRHRHISSPGEMQGIESLGVIADMQCGGWSTTLLTSKGALYTVGVLDGLQFNQRRPPYMQQIQTAPSPLRFPPGFPQPQDRYDPATAVKQFSSGRAHVLALSDSGRIWSWQNMDHPGLHVKFVHHEIKETGSNSGRGVIKKVVAGWNKSCALIEGTGIVVWEPLQMDPNESDVGDAVLVLESALVPRTRFTKDDEDQSNGVGEVQNFTVMEDTILFNTSTGKLFACVVTWTDQNQSVSDPVEIPIPAGKDAGSDAKFVTDVQGSFQNFAVFTKSGAVLTSNQDSIMPIALRQANNTSLFKRIPALQNKQVISLAFGDYHFHALHSPGYITSYGNEPQSCGALGLGGSGVPEGRLRGIRNQGIGGDGRLVPHAYTEGRRVWFEESKRAWIQFLTSGGKDQQEAAERIRMSIGSPGIDAQGELSEWIEQEGRDWEGKYGVREHGDEDDGLGAYFALSVSAAGWHSGALVLVNEEMADKLRRAVEIPDEPETHQENAGETSAAAATSANPERTSNPENQSFFDRAADLGRYFLGMAPYNVSSAAYDPNAPHLRHNTTHPATQSGNVQHHHLEAIDYGAAPREGYHYIWANDHFPRLKLKDGTEMPGEVPFDEWLYGRPDWKLMWEEDELEGDE